jgi:UDP-glucose 4-epimerase
LKALVTGGAGFIGSHLSEALLDEGHSVTALDNLSTGRLENIEHLSHRRGFELVVGDVADDDLAGRLVEQADVVFQLAAALGVKHVVDRPVHTIETNVGGTATVLRHASRLRKLTLVASTSEVYGKGTVLPFKEDADLVIGPPTRTRWGYATSKLIDEFLALGYRKEHGTPVIVVRFFNTVGPRQNPQYGMVLTNFVRQALSGRALTVHGQGHQTRSFTWVGDVVWAMLRLVEEPRAVGEVFNIGNGAEISIRDLASKVIAITGSSSDVVFTPYAEVFGAGFEDMSRRVPDLTKLRQTIGYEPQVHLDEIIERVKEFWLEQADAAPASLDSAVTSSDPASRTPELPLAG